MSDMVNDTMIDSCALTVRTQVQKLIAVARPHTIAFPFQWIRDPVILREASLSRSAAMRMGLACALLAVARMPSAGAQAAPSAVTAATHVPARAQARDTGIWQFGAYVATARSSPNNGALGTIPDRDHLIIGLQAGTTVLRLGPVRLSYVAQVLPMVRITDRKARDFDAYLDAAGIARIPGRAYAVGLVPFGLEVTSPSERRVSAFLSSAGGGLLFTSSYPDVTGRRTNFTLEAGGGFRVRFGHSQWAQLGYKYHHMSNAGTAFANPGLDGNLFYAGYQRAAKLPR